MMPHRLTLAGVLLLLERASAHPQYFLTGQDDGACGKLVSELSSTTGMLSNGYSGPEATVVASFQSGTTFTFSLSSTKYFATAKVGTLSTSAGSQGSSCSKFVYSGSTVSPTITWTLPGGSTGTHTLEVGRAVSERNRASNPCPSLESTFSNALDHHAPLAC